VDETDRARAIERLLPPLVHRLNNALALCQGVLELGPGASELDRHNARRELGCLGASLARLAQLARPPSTRAEVVALDPIGESCALLLGPLARALRVELAVRAGAGLSARADARLETLVLVATFELLELLAARAPAARRLRLTLDARAGRARISLAAAAALDPARVPEALQTYARERGLAFRRRVTARGTGLCLCLPLLSSGPPAPARAPRRRVLLVQEEGQDRELAATLLREHGCEVREEPRVPEAGWFELVLLDERALAADPQAGARLERLACARVERFRPPLRPAELLRLLQA